MVPPPHGVISPLQRAAAAANIKQRRRRALTRKLGADARELCRRLRETQREGFIGRQGRSDQFRQAHRLQEAGADAALTQLFYNPGAYLHFMERCAKAGITIPVVPGIMPITGFANTVRFCAGCGADLPRWVKLRLEELQDDKQALVEFGLDVVAQLCQTLLANGAPGLHFYTVNQAGPTLTLLERVRA